VEPQVRSKKGRVVAMGKKLGRTKRVGQKAFDKHLGRDGRSENKGKVRCSLAGGRARNQMSGDRLRGEKQFGTGNEVSVKKGGKEGE